MIRDAAVRLLLFLDDLSHWPARCHGCGVRFGWGRRPDVHIVWLGAEAVLHAACFQPGGRAIHG